MTDPCTCRQVEIKDGGQTVAAAQVAASRQPGGRARAPLHAAPGHVAPGTRTRLVSDVDVAAPSGAWRAPARRLLAAVEGPTALAAVTFRPFPQRSRLVTAEVRARCEGRLALSRTPGEQVIEKVSPVPGVIIAVGLGGVSGLLAVLAGRVLVLGWLILAPLAAAVYLYSPVAAGLAGAVAGALAVAPAVGGIPRWAKAGIIVISAICWGVVYALAAWMWPPGVPAWGAVIMPVAALALSAVARFAAPPGYGGGSRFGDCFLRSQQRWPPVVHVARLGSDLVIPLMLALAASIPVMLLVQLPPSVTTAAVAGAAALIVAGALGFGFASYGRTIGRAGEGQPVRVAAISVDDPFDGYARSPAYRDVEARIAKYQPQVAYAAAHGARLIVLPEHAAIVTARSRRRWREAVSQWARQAKAILVTGVFDDDVGHGQLMIADETGAIVATYEKQHPVPGAEPRRKVRMPPALLSRGPFPVSAVICYDGNFNDLVRPVARAGGLLAIPSNDWKEIEQLHSPSAVWVAVMTGVPLIRSVGHGRSVVFDAAGRLVAMASSFDGPVALVADVPSARRAAKPGP